MHPDTIGIGEAAGRFGVSTRTLRYYEQLGLVTSHKTETGYRRYDEAALLRLQQILILRRLRVPLEDIRTILASGDGLAALALLRRQLAGLDAEIAGLAAVREALAELMRRVYRDSAPGLPALAEQEILQLVQALPSETTPKEVPAMQSPQTSPYRQGDVRILYLPPATVAAVRRVGPPEPEEQTRALTGEFIRKHRLAEIKPDFRHYGFNSPNGERPDGSDHGYERWLTIPEGLEVEPPFEKKHFEGGLFAARTIPFGSFEEWEKLYTWMGTHPEYEPAPDPEKPMNGLLEEELDAIHLYTLPAGEQLQRLQLDLLLPVRRREG